MNYILVKQLNNEYQSLRTKKRVPPIIMIAKIVRIHPHTDLHLLLV